MSERYAFILLNKKKFWNRLCRQNRTGKALHVFVRRGKVGPKKAELLLFYVNRPAKQIRGVAEFIERITGDADDLWNAYGNESCLKSYEEYVNFLQGRPKATFIRFKNLRELPVPIPISVISKVTGIGRMPRSGKYINKKTVNQLIHGAT
jgi:predicted transcriptional regulator